MFFDFLLRNQSLFVILFFYLCAMKDMIEHKGIIESIDDECIKVRISQTSACSACTAKSLCQSAESKDKVVEVNRDRLDEKSVFPKVGDEVTVYGSTTMGRDAVVFAFVIPLIILTAVIAVGIKVVKMSEPMSIGIAFGALAVWYFILYLLKDRLSKRFVFNFK